MFIIETCLPIFYLQCADKSRDPLIGRLCIPAIIIITLFFNVYMGGLSDILCRTEKVFWWIDNLMGSLKILVDLGQLCEYVN